jgi:hypothetical protein
MNTKAHFETPLGANKNQLSLIRATFTIVSKQIITIDLVGV